MRRVTEQELSAAQRFLEEMQKSITALRDPDSMEFLHYTQRQRDMMIRSYEAKAQRARANLDELRARFEREKLEPEPGS